MKIIRNIFLALALLFVAMAPISNAQVDSPVVRIVIDGAGVTKDTPLAQAALAETIKELSEQHGVTVIQSDGVAPDDPQTLEITFISQPESNSSGTEIFTVLFGVHEPGTAYFVYLDCAQGELDKTATPQDVAQIIMHTAASDYGKYLSYQAHQQQQKSQPAPKSNRHNDVITPDTRSHA